MSRSKRNGELNTELIEKVMLTVTEINGCEVCSVFHNRVAEKEEIKEEDIQVLFVADFEEIPQDEAPAILFACLIFTLTAPLYIWQILGM